MQLSLVLLALALGCLALVQSAPLRSNNDAQNVNRKAGVIDPELYEGSWPGHVYFASPDDWRTIPVYQLVTDRFADGDPTNNERGYGGFDVGKVDTRHGGDLRGLMDKLDYVKSLGFRAIWISPIFQNEWNSYHGYAQVDFTLIDPRWGTLEDLRALTDAAHARGLYVIVDIVANHMANRLFFDGFENGPAPFRFHTAEHVIKERVPGLGYEDFVVNNTWDPNGYYGTAYNSRGLAVSDDGKGSFSWSDFHHNGDLADYEDVWQNHLGKIYGIMDDLRTTHPRVQSKLIAMTKALVASADIDGIRMDTPMQVPLAFFQNWVPAVRSYAASLGKRNFLFFGEFYCSDQRAATMTGRGKTVDMYGKDQYIGPQTFDGGIYYPFYFRILASVRDQGAGALNAFSDIIDNAKNNFDFYNPQHGWNFEYRNYHFYNNHDQKRIASSSDGFLKTDLATAFISFFPGIPLFYYGDDQGLLTDATALDGWSREYFGTSIAWRNLKTVNGANPADADNFNFVNAHFLWTQKINNIRALYKNLQTCDTYDEKWRQTQGTAGLLLIFRGCGPVSDHVLIGWNTWKNTVFTTNSFLTGFPANSRIVNVLDTNERYTLNSEGALAYGFSINGYGTKVFVLESSLKELMPTITTITPVHDEALSSSPATIQLAFSTAMNSASLLSENKVLLDNQPVPAANLRWDDATRVLTITVSPPLGEGIHYVGILEDVRSISGLTMNGRFHSRFLIGDSKNILLYPFASAAGTDNALLSWATDAEIDVMFAAAGYDVNTIKADPSKAKVILNHKATGASWFRVVNWDEGSTYSAWQPYQKRTPWLLPAKGATGKLTVQYYADHSSAYFVIGCLFCLPPTGTPVSL